MYISQRYMSYKIFIIKLRKKKEKKKSSFYQTKKKGKENSGQFSLYKKKKDFYFCLRFVWKYLLLKKGVGNLVEKFIYVFVVS